MATKKASELVMESLEGISHTGGQTLPLSLSFLHQLEILGAFQEDDPSTEWAMLSDWGWQ